MKIVLDCKTIEREIFTLKKRTLCVVIALYCLLSFLLSDKSFALSPNSLSENELAEYTRTKISNEAVSWYEQEIEPISMQVCRDKVPCRVLPSEASELIRLLSQNELLTVSAIAYRYNDSPSFFYKVESDTPFYVRVQYLSPVSSYDYQLPVECILQKPELPNGCEVTSLAIVLNYLGVDVDKCTLSDKYLPKSSSLSADPNKYYLREPRSNGFYCFAPPLIECVDNYCKDNNVSLSTKDLTGKDVSYLYEEIRNGNPVIVWGTLVWAVPGKYDSGLYYNLHCLVLSGYTDSTVTIQDPLVGTTTISRFRFEDIWYKMQQRAMVVYK